MHSLPITSDRAYIPIETNHQHVLVTSDIRPLSGSRAHGRMPTYTRVSRGHRQRARGYSKPCSQTVHPTGQPQPPAGRRHNPCRTCQWLPQGTAAESTPAVTQRLPTPTTRTTQLTPSSPGTVRAPVGRDLHTLQSQWLPNPEHLDGRCSPPGPEQCVERGPSRK